MDLLTAVRRSSSLEGGRVAEAGAVLTDLHPILPPVHSAPLRSLHFSPRAEGDGTCNAVQKKGHLGSGLWSLP